MEELISLIITLTIIIPIAILIYKASKNENVNKYVNEQFNNNIPLNITQKQNTDLVYDGVIYDKNEPLDKNIFIQQMTYADRKQDSRTDEILNTLDTILFWIRIIGIYVLIKFIILIIKIIAGISAGTYIIEMLSGIL